ncbi:hypothetical protein DW741_12145 [Ruminococcaceae bacterium AM28-23LB]|nr:hypothetical protein DW741_12145 [Ruminococcaceae bacterium AM28-23LB]
MTRKNLMISAAALSLLVLAGCSKDGMAGYIGTAEAKNVALENAGLTASQVKFTDVELDDKNGTHYYQVEFTADGKEYEYDIDALTGAIIESKLPAGAQAQQNTASNNNTAGNTTPDTNTAGSSNTNNNTSNNTTPDTNTVGSSNTNNNTSSGTGTASAALTADQAKDKALAHAGLKANQVTFVKSKLDWDDGRQVYDVEFYTSDYKEYDYEIDASTGEVVSYDFDAEGYAPPATGNGQSGTITADQAKEKALSQVPGATVSDIWEFETDYDDGRLQYEGKIYYNGMEYEFEIDGYSGAIRSWDAESMFD